MRILVALSVLLTFFASVLEARGHEVRPAYLEIRETAHETYRVSWKVPARGENLRLGVYVSLPQDVEKLTEPHQVFAGGALLEQHIVRRAGGLAGQTISFDGLAATKIEVLARVEHADGVTQTIRVTPDEPSFVVEATPSTWAVAATYLVIGAEHILLGIDHLLFVLALVLVVNGWKKLVGAITAFTIAHSVTLGMATLGYVHVPGPPVEACIALSIVFVSAEILRSHHGQPGLTEHSPWIVAFSFGLLHGLGFAGALSDVGLPGHAIPLALLFFNIGVEVGQLAFVGCVIAIARATRRLPIASTDHVGRLVPYATGSIAMFWVIERTLGFVP